MDFIRGRSVVVNNQKGQTIVEYILLIVVVITLVMTFYKSSFFKKFFGEEGKLGEKMKTQNEFSYRHAFYKPGFQDNSREEKDITGHPSYKGDNEPTRFFGPKEAYGD